MLNTAEVLYHFDEDAHYLHEDLEQAWEIAFKIYGEPMFKLVPFQRDLIELKETSRKKCMRFPLSKHLFRS